MRDLLSPGIAARWGIGVAAPQGFGQAQKPTLVQTTFRVGSSSRMASSMLLRFPQTMPLSFATDLVFFVVLAFMMFSFVTGSDPFCEENVTTIACPMQ
jgi:hypothetical protein